MRHIKFIVYLIIPILLLMSGWVAFNKYIRPNHYQLLYPYSAFQFRNSTLTEKRIGKDSRIQILITEGKAVVGKDEYLSELDIDRFWIDQIPVTVSDYKKFISQTQKLAPRYRNEYAQYWQDKIYELFPVVFVSWDQAEDYCEYYGGHLPTEAQWEKAARGPEGIILYWDDSVKAFDRANYDYFFKDKTPAGWLPKGKSVYGVIEMSGNVREWVMDWMTGQNAPLRTDDWIMLRDEEPVLAEPGRILKGGAFSDDLSHLRLNFRDHHDPNSPGINRGFRCVYDE